jgi:hypothetical protein
VLLNSRLTHSPSQGCLYSRSCWSQSPDVQFEDDGGVVLLLIAHTFVGSIEADCGVLLLLIAHSFCWSVRGGLRCRVAVARAQLCWPDRGLMPCRPAVVALACLLQIRAVCCWTLRAWYAVWPGREWALTPCTVCDPCCLVPECCTAHFFYTAWTAVRVLGWRLCAFTDPCMRRPRSTLSPITCRVPCPPRGLTPLAARVDNFVSTQRTGA